MSRLIGRAFSAVLAADHGGSDLRRLGECMTQQIGKEPQSFASPSTFIVEHQAPSRPTPQGCWPSPFGVPPHKPTTVIFQPCHPPSRMTRDRSPWTLLA